MLAWLAPIALLSARIAWQRWPGIVPCAVFWGLSAAILVIGWPFSVSQVTFATGIACNAAVTLANGGYMPVAAHRRVSGPARSLWVQRQTGQRLLFLADNFGNRWIRFSIGDVFLLAGIIISLAGY